MSRGSSFVGGVVSVEAMEEMWFYVGVSRFWSWGAVEDPFGRHVYVLMRHWGDVFLRWGNTFFALGSRWGTVGETCCRVGEPLRR